MLLASLLALWFILVIFVNLVIFQNKMMKAQITNKTELRDVKVIFFIQCSLVPHEPPTGATAAALLL